MRLRGTSWPSPFAVVAFVATATLAAAVACGSGRDERADAPDDAAGSDETPNGPADASPRPFVPEFPDADGADGAAPMGPALVPGCTAKATLAGYPTWMFFTRPDAPCTKAEGGGIDSHILGELVRLVSSVPPGGRIDGHVFSISVPSVAQALVDAQARGVEVWLSTDGAVAEETSVAKALLDQLTHKVYCSSSDRTSCIGTASGAISHTKLFTFTSATTPDGAIASDVVWLGSANQTYSSGMNLYNNTVTIYGDKGLYGSLRKYLDDLYARTPHDDYYDPAGRGHLLEESADVYISPELTTDLVVNRLDDVTPDATCEVRVMQASIRDSRMAVVDRLVALKQGGCKVQIAAHTVEPSALSALTAAGISIREKPIHDKVFVVKAKYGAALEHRVYTGSHNLSISANTKYDEIFVKLAAEPAAMHPVHDAFVAHFDDAWNDGTPLN